MKPAVIDVRRAMKVRSHPVQAPTMIVTSSDLSAQAVLQVQARLLPDVPITPAANQVTAPAQSTATPLQAPVVVTADPLAALLQNGLADAPDATLPTADLARRYAESGTLTQRPPTDVMLRAPAGGLAPADTGLLSNLSQAYRQTATDTPVPQQANVPRELANAQLPNAPSTGGNTPTVIVVDGRAIPLNPTQVALVRANLDAAFRKAGPGIGGSDGEDPTIMAHDSTAADVVHKSSKVQSVEASPRAPVESRERHAPPAQDDGLTLQAALGNSEEVEAVRAIRHEQPAPYEPQVILPRPQDQVVIAPGPDRVILAGQQPAEPGLQAAITGIAIAVAPGITRDDVTAELHQDGYRLTFAGSSDSLLLHASAGLSAQLMFADGTSMRLQLNHD